MQKVGITDLKNNGASVLPSKSMANLVSAYCFDQKMVVSFNTFINDQSVADHYGVPVNTSLSIPLQIEKGKLIQITSIPVTESEKKTFKRSSKRSRERNKIISRWTFY